jgi:hypothetical protein
MHPGTGTETGTAEGRALAAGSGDSRHFGQSPLRARIALLLALPLLAVAGARLGGALRDAAAAPLVSGDLFAAYLPPVQRLLDGDGLDAWASLKSGSARMPGYPCAIFALSRLLSLAKANVELVEVPSLVAALSLAVLVLGLALVARRVAPSRGTALLIFALSLAGTVHTRAFYEASRIATPDLMCAALIPFFLLALDRRAWVRAGVCFGLLTLIRLNAVSLAVPGLIAAVQPGPGLDRRRRLADGGAALLAGLLTMSIWTPVSVHLAGTWFMVNGGNGPGFHPDLLAPAEAGQYRMNFFHFLGAHPLLGLIRGARRGLLGGPLEMMLQGFSTWPLLVAAILLLARWSGRRTADAGHARSGRLAASCALAFWPILAAVPFEPRYDLPIFVMLAPVASAAVVEWVGRRAIAPVVGAVGAAMLALGSPAAADVAGLEGRRAWYAGQVALVERVLERIGPHQTTFTASRDAYYNTAARYLTWAHGRTMDDWEDAPPAEHAVWLDVAGSYAPPMREPFASPELLFPASVRLLPGALDAPEAWRTLRAQAFLSRPAMRVVAPRAPAALADRTSTSAIEVPAGEPLQIDFDARLPIDGLAIAPAWSRGLGPITALEIDGERVPLSEGVESSDPLDRSPRLIRFGARPVRQARVVFGAATQVSEVRGLYRPPLLERAASAAELVATPSPPPGEVSATLAEPGTYAVYAVAATPPPSLRGTVRVIGVESGGARRELLVDDDRADAVWIGELPAGQPWRVTLVARAKGRAAAIPIARLEIRRLRESP